MSTPNKTVLLQSLKRVPSDGGVTTFVNELMNGFTNGASPQSPSSNPTVIPIGNKFRIVALPNGAAFQVLGIDKIWHTHQTLTEP